MRTTDRIQAVSLVTSVPVASYGLRNANSSEWGSVRYKAKKGRAVTRAERPTYDLATASMLAGRIDSWHIYEDGWTFTFAAAPCMQDQAPYETLPMTRATAHAYLLDLTITTKDLMVNAAA